jgi:hypothetical protein
LSTEKKQKYQPKEPEADEEDDDNEIRGLVDPEKITIERGGWGHYVRSRCFILPQRNNDLTSQMI